MSDLTQTHLLPEDSDYQFDGLLQLGGTVARTSKASGGGSKIVGGAGADTLVGQSGDDTIDGRGGDDLLFGASGNDTLMGGDGNDVLAGGDGDDVLTGGKGDDQMLGGAGNDRMIWNPGDGSDLVEGGDGIDRAEVNGGSEGEVFAITANGDRVRLDRIEPAPFALDIGTTEELVIKTGGGDDSISAVGNLAALIQLTIDGGDGNDTIRGGNGADTLFGGKGNDFVDGNQGSDVAFLGAGDDVFQWDPGDGSDTVEGGAGTDTLLFNGSNGAEVFDLAANGDRLRFTRNLGSIVMDVNDVELVEINALGSADTINVGDLDGTGVDHVAVDLAATIGGTTGDGQADTVNVRATNDADTVLVTSVGGQTIVDGLSAEVTVDHADSGDRVVVDGLDGDDTIDASTHAAGPLTLQLSGGAGDDFLIGSAGDDVIGGDAGDDLLFGNAGNDTFGYASVLDGHDVIADFDGDAAGGQDVVNLDALFDALGVADVDRAGRVSLTDHGGSVTLAIDADGNAGNGFELQAMTLLTADAVSLGVDVILSA